jgi:hypothetical protein
MTELTREQKIRALRDAATWLEENPQIPFPTTISDHTYVITLLNSKGTKEDVSNLAKAANFIVKGFSEERFVFIANLEGTIEYVLSGDRKEICKRKVVGKKTVQETRPIAFETVETEADVVEWECEPIL